MNLIRLYHWNPNGTNDCEILDKNFKVIDTIPELTFGINITGKRQFIALKKVIQNIAVSPVDDGKDKLKQLAKHFPTLQRKIKTLVRG